MYRLALLMTFAIGLLAAQTTVSLAADAVGCKAPSWAPQRISGYEIDSCETKNWAGYDAELPQGTKTIYGRRETVSFTLANDSQNVSAASARSFYLQQAQKAGAKLVSDPDNVWSVVLTQKTPQGELWYVYEHGSGNEESTGSYTLTTVHVVPLPQVVTAQAMKTAPDPLAKKCANPPWLVKQFAHYKIDTCDGRARDQVEVDLPAGSKTLNGARTTTTYTVDDDKNAETAAFVQKNYVTALKAIGATLMSDPADLNNAVLMQKTPLGEFWYIYTHGSGNDESTSSYSVTTVQIAAPPQLVQAQAMKGPLDTLAKCSDPPWLSKQFPQYRVSECDNRIWDVVQLDLANGQNRNLEGKRASVTYELTDDTKTETAATIEQNYMQALKSMGATVMSDPSDANRLVATQKAPAGEFWFIYEHGSGNDESTSSYSLTTVQIAPFPQVVQAQLMKAGLTAQSKPCHDPDWLVKQFSYFVISDCSYRDFDSVTFELPGGKKTVAGRVLETDFAISDPKQTPTQLYASRNYVNALRAIGAKLVSDPNDAGHAVFTQKTEQGEFWYAYSATSGNQEATNSYTLTTVQIGGPPPKACTLEVYGVNFDFNKSTLRPDSEPVLQQLLAMFKADPKYAAEIGGHTDNIGTKSYNAALSGARAEAVRAWLVGHGIAAGRLSTHGYGDTKPLVPNDTDAHRARNRRVELKRMNCK